MWRGLWQAFAALFGASFTAAACYAAGCLLLHRLSVRQRLARYEQVPLTFVLGASCVHLLVFAIFAAQIAYWPVIVAALLALIVAAIRGGCWRLTGNQPDPFPRALTILTGVCVAPFLALYFINALAPESSSDGSGYHLGVIAGYLRARGFYPITTNMYAALGGGLDVLFAPAFAIGRHSAGALVHFSFLIALALSMLAYGRRIEKPWAGAAGALLVFLSPVVARDGTSAYIDLGAAAVVFAAFYWLEIWQTDRDSRLLIPVGLLAGYAYAVKYTAAAILIYALVLVAWRARRLAPLLTITAGATTMAAPWIVRNWIWFQNPIAPLGNAWFPNRHFYILSEQDWAGWLRSYGLPNMWQLPLEVTVRGLATSGIIGPAFLLVPLALLSLRYPVGRRLLAAGAAMLATYPANIGTRFLIPALPFLALALTLTVREWKPVLALLMIAHSVASWPTVIRRYAPGAWRIEHFPIRAALRLEDTDTFLRRVHRYYILSRLVEEHVPKGEAVLGMNGVADSYTTRDVRVSFLSAPNMALAETVNMGWSWGTHPLRAWAFHFPPAKVHRVRIVQTEEAQYPEQWNVHELRFFRNGNELARNPHWHLTAIPNPWDVTYAFDNSPVTRWRSWEVARPGMFIEVDFGSEVEIDEARVVTSADYKRVRLRLEESTASGEWKKLGPPPQEVQLGEPRQVRREAIHEMHLRGVNYLLIQPQDFGAADFREDPEGWGLKIVAESPVGVLYRSVW